MFKFTVIFLTLLGLSAAVHPGFVPRSSFYSHLHDLSRASHCVCPANYAPVCCLSSTGLETAGNACSCDCNNKGRPVYPGPCMECACPLIYAPVCCKLFGEHITAGNDCQCKCMHGTSVSDGACPSAPVETPPVQTPPVNCVCPAIYAPVCCQTSHGTSISPNKCVCACGGGKTVHNGAC